MRSLKMLPFQIRKAIEKNTSVILPPGAFLIIRIKRIPVV